MVVLGHMVDEVRSAIEKAVPANPRLRFVTNPDFAEGLSTSVRSGVAALGKDISPATFDAALAFALPAFLDSLGGACAVQKQG